MEDDNLKEQKKQQEKQEAGQKTAHVAGKGAATYFGGGAGGALYNAASNTEVGKKIEQAAGNVIQKIPVVNKATQDLNKSGALDAVDKGLDLASGNSDDLLKKGQNNLKNGNNIEGIAKNVEDDKKEESSSNSLLGDDKKDSLNEDSNSDFNIMGFLNNPKKKKTLLIGAIVPVIVLFLLIILVAASLLYPLQVAKDFVEGIGNAIVNFFTKDQQQLEQEFYQELKDVQQEFNSEYNVCIDVNLITASLMVNQTIDKIMEEGGEIIENGEDIVDSEGNEKTVPYTKMKKQIRLLARMQMMTNRFELDTKSDSYCSNENVGGIAITEGEHDSSSFELIAKHDIDGFQAFFTSKVNEEQNNAYYIYRPPFKEDGTCSKSYAEKMLPETSVILSIGDANNPTESVFYWNLVNSFIPSYYDEYISSVEPERTKDIKRIADEIYLLYDQLGPSRTCAISYAGPSSLCPNGVTVVDTGTFALEEYVSGVVGAEMYESFPLESKKALAVAARTYVLKLTNYCSKSIVNSSAAQNFTRNYSDSDRQAALETAGEILVDSNGSIFLSEYDSWNCKGQNTCSYQYIPDGGSHSVSISDRYLSLAAGGHGRGMSQIAAADMAYNGSNYKEILEFFYKGSTINLVLSPTTTEGSEIITGPITNYIASIQSFNQLIYSQVAKSGISTREGVVAAATTLVSEFYNQTGYKLPYELRPSGKYSGYGMDPNWGTNTGDATYPLNGLDCSGFVSWAIHNGGYAYEVKSAKGWGDTGTKRSWSKGTTDSSARPGDLIYNAPASANGTTGHIRMIIAVNNDGYVIAEASSGKNGIRITNVSFKSTGSYYLVDMSNYYANAKKVTDYPV